MATPTTYTPMTLSKAGEPVFGTPIVSSSVQTDGPYYDATGAIYYLDATGNPVYTGAMQDLTNLPAVTGPDAAAFRAAVAPSPIGTFWNWLNDNAAAVSLAVSAAAFIGGVVMERRR